MTFQILIEVLKGGPGSGNFGHAGRPGKRGGSAPKWSMADPQELNNYYQLMNKCGSKYGQGGGVNCGALNDYTGTGYDVANNLLRKGTIHNSAHEYEYKLSEVKDMIKNLDSTFENAPTTPKHMVVYRGVNANVLKGLQPGDEFIDKGFVSTSIDPTQTMSGLQMELRIPKGSKGIYVEQVSQVESEMELLLNRGSKFKIIDRLDYTNKYGNPAGKIVAELVN